MNKLCNVKYLCAAAIHTFLRNIVDYICKKRYLFQSYTFYKMTNRMIAR